MTDELKEHGLTHYFLLRAVTAEERIDPEEDYGEDFDADKIVDRQLIQVVEERDGTIHEMDNSDHEFVSGILIKKQNVGDAKRIADKIPNDKIPLDCFLIR